MRQAPERDGEMLKRMRQQGIDELNLLYAGIDFTIKEATGYHRKSGEIAKYARLVRKEKIREALEPVIGANHRLESLGLVKNVEYINDSRATNRNATRFALEMMEKPTVLIIGGVNKLPQQFCPAIGDLLSEKVKGVVVLGKQNEWLLPIVQELGVPVRERSSMHYAVAAASELAEPGDVVLLSPAAASFDLFKNLEDRGDQFTREVRNL